MCWRAVAKGRLEVLVLVYMLLEVKVLVPSSHSSPKLDLPCSQRILCSLCRILPVVKAAVAVKDHRSKPLLLFLSLVMS